MPLLDHTRFKRARPADDTPATPVVTDRVSGSVGRRGVHGAAYGQSPKGTMKVLEMHETPGRGQLTTDLTTQSLLEEVLVELRAIRIQINNPKGPESDLGRSMTDADH